MVHYGDTALTFLQNLYDAGRRGEPFFSYVSAVAVEEKSVWDYNQGNPSGAQETLGQNPPPETPLVAFYPQDGTLISDNPYVVLNAPWVDDAERAAAKHFLDWLREPDQQRRFQQAGFRSATGEPGPEISEQNGMLPSGPLNVLNPPNAAVLDELVTSWSTVRKRANLTFVMDVSGSMDDPVPGSTDPEADQPPQTKLDLVKSATEEALRKLVPDDMLSLWEFSEPRSPDTVPYRFRYLPVRSPPPGKRPARPSPPSRRMAGPPSTPPHVPPSRRCGSPTIPTGSTPSSC